MSLVSTTLGQLEQDFGAELREFSGVQAAIVRQDTIVAVIAQVKAAGFEMISDIFGIDYLEYPRHQGTRFTVVYNLYSISKNERIFIRVNLEDGEVLPTITHIWKGANFMEREVYDMFGIVFSDHQDMRRILLYEEFEGHPLRKDYPIHRAQPLVEYRDADDTLKLPPFGIEEGQPFSRIDWEERLAGRDEQVSPSIGLQNGQRRTLSDSIIAETSFPEVTERVKNEPKEDAAG